MSKLCRHDVHNLKTISFKYTNICENSHIMIFKNKPMKPISFKYTNICENSHILIFKNTHVIKFFYSCSRHAKAGISKLEIF